MTMSKFADPQWRIERARKAAHARNSIDSYIRSLVKAAPTLTPEQIQRLRDLLPPVAPSQDGGPA